MAIYPSLFGHVELPDTTSRRSDRLRAKEIGIRVVRPVDPYTEYRRRTDRSRA